MAARARKKITNGKSRNAKSDAETLLKADHRKVEGLFRKYEKSESDSEMGPLALK